MLMPESWVFYNLVFDGQSELVHTYLLCIYSSSLRPQAVHASSRQDEPQEGHGHGQQEQVKELYLNNSWVDFNQVK